MEVDGCRMAEEGVVEIDDVCFRAVVDVEMYFIDEFFVELVGYVVEQLPVARPPPVDALLDIAYDETL